MSSSTLSSALTKLRTALAFHGLRAREACDELLHTSPDAEVSLTLAEKPKGQLVRCTICLDESRLLTGGLEIFNELAQEGYPVVGFGAGFTKASFDFSWFHPEGADWRITGQRVSVLLERLACMLGERPSPVRPSSRAKRSSIYSELVPAVFGHAATAA